MERLTIKELAPYLPHGLNFKSGNETWLLTSLRTLDKYPIWAETRWNKKENKYKPEINNRGLCIGYGFKLKDIKPLLRPLSSIDLKWFQDNIDEALEDFRINCEPENNHFSVEVCEKVLGWSALSLEEYQLFYRDHVDIHGLIDRNLALPIDGKEVEGE